MAYKPKFSQPRQEFVRQQVVETPPRPLKKKKKKINGFFVALGFAVVPLSILATFWLLGALCPNLGRPASQAVHEKTADMAIMDRFDTYITNAKSDALEGVLSVKKRYWLSDDTKVAPEPDQSKFGEAETYDQMKDVLSKAEDILDGQKLFFNPEAKLFPDSKILYYLDESMFVVTWKEVRDSAVYTFSEVKITHPSQFRRHLAGGEYGSELQFMTTEMAESVNAVVASSGDFYRFRDWGTSVYEGTVRRVAGTYAHTCYIDRNGDLHFSYGGEITEMDQAQKYVDDNEILFSLAFGPVLVDNGVRKDTSWYGLGEVKEKYARAALCQMDSLHYLLVTVGSEGGYNHLPTVNDFAKQMETTGCKMAYCLDGGQTAAIVMNDQLINRVVYGYQRKISDIIYFATAVPEGG